MVTYILLGIVILICSLIGAYLAGLHVGDQIGLQKVPPVQQKQFEEARLMGREQGFIAANQELTLQLIEMFEEGIRILKNEQDLGQGGIITEKSSPAEEVILYDVLDE